MITQRSAQKEMILCSLKKQRTLLNSLILNIQKKPALTIEDYQLFDQITNQVECELKSFSERTATHKKPNRRFKNNDVKKYKNN